MLCYVMFTPRRRKRAPAACYWGCPGLCVVCSGEAGEDGEAADAASGTSDSQGAERAGARGADEMDTGDTLCGSCDEDGDGDGSESGNDEGGARRTRWTDSVLALRAAAARAMRAHVDGHADARLLHARRPRGIG